MEHKVGLLIYIIVVVVNSPLIFIVFNNKNAVDRKSWLYKYKLYSAFHLPLLLVLPFLTIFAQLLYWEIFTNPMMFDLFLKPFFGILLLYHIPLMFNRSRHILYILNLRSLRYGDRQINYRLTKRHRLLYFYAKLILSSLLISSFIFISSFFLIFSFPTIPYDKRCTTVVNKYGPKAVKVETKDPVFGQKVFNLHRTLDAERLRTGDNICIYTTTGLFGYRRFVSFEVEKKK